MAAFKDIKGEKYGKWTIIERGENKRNLTQWLCECECGKKKLIVSQEIHSGNAREDCGCSKQNWIGRKFNSLTVISKEGKKSFHNSYVNCRCECGNIKRTWGTTLLSERIKSCGCLIEKQGKNRCLHLIYFSYKKRGFNLSLDEFYKISQMDCYYCGSKPKNIQEKETKTKGKRVFIYNGIDRFDNKKGYVKENIVPCCGICNIMKNDMMFDDWKKHMEKILKNIEDKNLRALIG